MTTPHKDTVLGVSLGHRSGALVTATVADGVATAVELVRYGPNLEPLASEVRRLLLADRNARAVVDRGLRGRELLDQIAWTGPRKRLHVFDALAEDRRYRVAGRLTQTLESGTAKIRRDLLDDDLRATLAAASREDADARPEVVALSLALVDHRPVIGTLLTFRG